MILLIFDLCCETCNRLRLLYQQPIHWTGKVAQVTITSLYVKVSHW